MEIIKLTDVLILFPDAEFFGNKESEFHGVGSLEDEVNNQSHHLIYWLGDKFAEKYKRKINSEIGLLILTQKCYEDLTAKPANAIIAENPKLAFQKVLAAFFTKKFVAEIEQSAFISGKARIGKGVYIGRNVVIEENVEIGDNCCIGHNTVILSDTKIGNNVTIGCNCTIGSAGFGYAKEADEHYVQMPHLGNVVIKDFVTIHNNVCIDRAVMGSTYIEQHAKIDNLVHIAHGVVIGENTLVIANAMIGGSTKIGKNCWIAPSVSVMNKLTIGDNVVVGLGAVVIKDVEAGSTVVGNPARKING